MSSTDWWILIGVFVPWLWGILHIAAFVVRQINRHY
jgi:hypothetical protein